MALFVFCNLLLLLLAPFAASNIDQDRTECSDQLIGLAPCLPYVSGDAKTPTIDCCSGLKQVVQKSKKCLCVLIKDKDDPNLGLKINGSLALGLPNACHAPSNITECICKLTNLMVFYCFLCFSLLYFSLGHCIKHLECEICRLWRRTKSWV